MIEVRDDAPSGWRAAPTGRRIAALMLDDSDFDRQRMCRIGARSGLPIDIVAVPTIAAMKAELGKTDFDVILIDYLLDEGDGLQAAAAVKASRRNAGAATVMITGNGNPGLVREAMEQGCDDLFDKDALTPETFRDRLVAVLDRVSAEGEGRIAAALSPDRLHAAFAAAFTPETMQRMLAPVLRPIIEPMLVDGLTEALRRLDRSVGPARQGSVEALVRTLLDPDDFEFRT